MMTRCPASHELVIAPAGHLPPADGGNVFSEAEFVVVLCPKGCVISPVLAYTLLLWHTPDVCNVITA